MTIARKLIFTFGGIAVLLAFVSAYYLFTAFNMRSEMQHLERVSSYAMDVTNLVHELQVERGLTTGFLGSSDSLPSELQAQRQKVDAFYQLVINKHKYLSNLSPAQQNLSREIINYQNDLSVLRSRINSREAEVVQVFESFTLAIGKGIRFLNSEVQEADIAQAMQALRVLVTAKEYAGQERALGNAYFTRGAFTDVTRLHQFINLGAQRKALLIEFPHLAPAAQTAMLDKIMQEPAYQRLLDMEREALELTIAQQPLKASGQQWFETATERINSFKTVEESLQKHILEMVDDKISFANKVFWIVVSLILWVVFSMIFIYVSIVDRGIAKPLNLMVKRLVEITETAKFDARIECDTKDEIGNAARAVNSLLSQLNQAFSETNKVVCALAEGDFTQRITNNYVGDLDSLKQGINTSVENTTAVMKGLTEAMANLQQGKFGFQVDTNAPGDYGVMLENVAQTMRSLSLVVADINKIMNLLNDGDFSARVNAAAQGDLLTMSQVINTTMDTLDYLINDLVRMAQAQMEGDLTVISNASYKGRFDELQKARAESTERIKNVIGLALDASEVVFSASNQVSGDADDLASRVQEQAAALEETSATMQEMTSAVQANTENSQAASNLAHEVQQKSSEGLLVMQETIAAIRTIQESSSKISDIINIIDSIAFQTNLLALNAAVEAARAGEHGRGFAVVAGEVRALAGKSADAARDIKTLIEDSVSRVGVGTDLADKSGEALSSINESIREVALMIESISAASEQQSEAIAQVNTAVIDIDRITQENAALVEETSSAAQSLYNEASNLQSNMSFFNTGKPSLTKPKSTETLALEG